jgi:hypothetical protein
MKRFFVANLISAGIASSLLALLPTEGMAWTSATFTEPAPPNLPPDEKLTQQKVGKYGVNFNYQKSMQTDAACKGFLIPYGIQLHGFNPNLTKADQFILQVVEYENTSDRDASIATTKPAIVVFSSVQSGLAENDFDRPNPQTYPKIGTNFIVNEDGNKPIRILKRTDSVASTYNVIPTADKQDKNWVIRVLQRPDGDKSVRSLVTDWPIIAKKDVILCRPGTTFSNDKFNYWDSQHRTLTIEMSTQPAITATNVPIWSGENITVSGSQMLQPNALTFKDVSVSTDPTKAGKLFLRFNVGANIQTLPTFNINFKGTYTNQSGGMIKDGLWSVPAIQLQ